MKVLVTGAGGMLARAVVSALGAGSHEVVALARADLDVTDPAAVRSALLRARPAAVVQCAAYTRVDDAEHQEALARAVNAEATASIALVCQELDALLVYPSTDYVFPGDADRPYRPGDATGPLNAYGRSKLAGEAAAALAPRSLVVRTGWLYGAGGTNFVDTMLRLARERPELRVVDDQTGRPTWTRNLAAVVVELIERGTTGILHCSDGGAPGSWYDVARTAIGAAGLETPVAPVGSAEFPRPAPRPRYSVLEVGATEALLGRTMPEWRASVVEYVRETRTDW